MEFNLITVDGNVTTYQNDALCEFNNAGLLIIRTNEGARRTYSPTAWLYIDEGTQDQTSRAIAARASTPEPNGERDR